MTTLKVNATLFNIVSGFASNDDTRYYMCGVHITPRENGGVFLVATDGHRLFVACDMEGNIEGDSVTISPNKAILSACKKDKRAKQDNTLHLNSDGTIEVKAFESTVGIQTRDALCDGTFPQAWRRVIPTTCSDTVGFVNVSGILLKSFIDASCQLAGSNKNPCTMSIQPSETHHGAYLIRYEGFANVLGVLMPKKIDEDISGIPNNFFGDDVTSEVA